MPVSFRSVKNIALRVKSKISPYISGLLLHDSRKTCTAMARKLCVPVKRMYNLFRNAKGKITTIKLDLQMIANDIKVEGEKRVLAID